MASEQEHEHNALIYGDEQGKVYLLCSICGQKKDLVELYGEVQSENNLLEQQLAQAREELRIALAQRQDYRARLTQARALLEEVLPDSLPNWEQLIACSICGCSATRVQKIEHDDNCPIPRIDAFLAQHPASEQ